MDDEAVPQDQSPEVTKPKRTRKKTSVDSPKSLSMAHPTPDIWMEIGKLHKSDEIQNQRLDQMSRDIHSIIGTTNELNEKFSEFSTKLDVLPEMGNYIAELKERDERARKEKEEAEKRDLEIRAQEKLRQDQHTKTLKGVVNRLDVALVSIVMGIVGTLIKNFTTWPPQYLGIAFCIGLLYAAFRFLWTFSHPDTTKSHKHLPSHDEGDPN